MKPKTITLEQLDQFSVDESGQLFWKNKPVVTKSRVTLRWFELSLAVVAAIGTLASGLHPFMVSFGYLLK